MMITSFSKKANPCKLKATVNPEPLFDIHMSSAARKPVLWVSHTLLAVILEKETRDYTTKVAKTKGTNKPGQQHS